MKLALLALVAVAGVTVTTVGCGKSQDDPPPPPQQLGFVPPPTAQAAAPSATETATAAPAFTSYFSTLDSGGPSASAGGATAATARPAQRAPDPDVAASESLRSRFDGCFPQLHLARGQSRNISVAFTVIATGRVSRYDISGAAASDGAFYGCVQNVAAGASFPERTTKAVAGGPPPVGEVRTVTVTAGATAS